MNTQGYNSCSIEGMSEINTKLRVMAIETFVFGIVRSTDIVAARCDYRFTLIMKFRTKVSYIRLVLSLGPTYLHQCLDKVAHM